MQEEKNQLNNASLPASPKGFKSKVLPIILSIVGLLLVILIIALGALLAGHVWNPTWNPFKQKAQSQIK